MSYNQMPEFELIKKYFATPAHSQANIPLGIGDDAAVINVPSNQQLVVCVDTIVAGQHFLPNTPAAAIAHRALAINLSDIAAMGAHPRWFTLALTIPNQHEQWLANFSQGLFALANKYQVTLIGGDTTQGPLTVTIQVLGTIAPDAAIKRSGAKVGDKIYVTGTLGDAGAGLAICRGRQNTYTPEQKQLCQRYQYPEPRVAMGEKLLGIATSMLDISDGLAADLNHLLEQSHVGAKIYTKDLPISKALSKTVVNKNALHYALTAGDDYELCFTLPVAKEAQVLKIAHELEIACTCIGEITLDLELQIIDLQGERVVLDKLGWEFF